MNCKDFSGNSKESDREGGAPAPTDGLFLDTKETFDPKFNQFVDKN
jgi:hypothetical protein